MQKKRKEYTIIYVHYRKQNLGQKLEVLQHVVLKIYLHMQVPIPIFFASIYAECKVAIPLRYAALFMVP